MPPGAKPPELAVCLDCGVPLKRRGATRCRLHANRANNAQKAGSFTTESARAAVVARGAKRAAEQAELARVTAELAEGHIQFALWNAKRMGKHG